MGYIARVEACAATGTPIALASDFSGWRSKACRTRRTISSVCLPVPATRQRDRRRCSVRRRIPPVHGLQGVFRWNKQGDGQRCQEDRIGDPCHIGGRRHSGYAPGVVPEGRTRQLIGGCHRTCRRRATCRRVCARGWRPHQSTPWGNTGSEAFHSSRFGCFSASSMPTSTRLTTICTKITVTRSKGRPAG